MLAMPTDPAACIIYALIALVIVTRFGTGL